MYASTMTFSSGSVRHTYDGSPLVLLDTCHEPGTPSNFNLAYNQPERLNIRSEIAGIDPQSFASTTFSSSSPVVIPHFSQVFWYISQESICRRRAWLKSVIKSVIS